MFGAVFSIHELSLLVKQNFLTSRQLQILFLAAKVLSFRSCNFYPPSCDPVCPTTSHFFVFRYPS